jgi:hypothetical protein
LGIMMKQYSRLLPTIIVALASCTALTATTINATVIGTTSTTLTEQVNIPAGAPTFSDTLDFLSFNSSLGTLTGMVITATGNFLTNVSATNPTSGTLNYLEIDGIGHSTLTGPAALNIILTATASGFANDQNNGDPLTAGGVAAFNGLFATATNSANPTDFSDWTGDGVTAIATTFAAGRFGVNGLGDPGINYSANGTNAGVVTVEYIYTPSSQGPVAPEPATWALMGTALLGLGAARKRLGF